MRLERYSARNACEMHAGFPKKKNKRSLFRKLEFQIDDICVRSSSFRYENPYFLGNTWIVRYHASIDPFRESNGSGIFTFRGHEVLLPPISKSDIYKVNSPHQRSCSWSVCKATHFVRVSRARRRLRVGLIRYNFVTRGKLDFANQLRVFEHKSYKERKHYDPSKFNAQTLHRENAKV